jgi:hypothetical protein
MVSSVVQLRKSGAEMKMAVDSLREQPHPGPSRLAEM